MDPHSNTEPHDESDAGRPPVRRDEAMKNAVAQWTPEDASRFLSAAIHEAQRPLADALRQRPVSTPVLALIIALLVVAGAAIGWILSRQLEKSESAADKARHEREAAVAKSYELQSRSDTLSMRLKSAEERHEQAVREYAGEAERLRTESAGLRESESDLQRTRTELARHRRQNELLRNQISGLEMEKQALARQLEAVKALMLSDDDAGLDKAESAEEAASAAAPSAPAVPASAAPATPSPVAPAAPVSSSPVAPPAAPAAPVVKLEPVHVVPPAPPVEAAPETPAAAPAPSEAPATPDTPAAPEAPAAPDTPEKSWEAPDASSAAPEPDSAASDAEARNAAEADEPMMAY